MALPTSGQLIITRVTHWPRGKNDTNNDNLELDGDRLPSPLSHPPLPADTAGLSFYGVFIRAAPPNHSRAAIVNQGHEFRLDLIKTRRTS